MHPLIPDKTLREQIVGVSGVTWCTWRKAGKLPPAIRFGRRYFYRREDVDRWLEERVGHYSAHGEPKSLPDSHSGTTEE